MLSTPLHLPNLKLLSVVNSDSRRTAALLRALHHLWECAYSPWFIFKSPTPPLARPGTSVHWGPVWSATTSQDWWTNRGICASVTQTSCRRLERAPRSGSESASTSSGTTAGTAARWTVTTPCSDVSCSAVSPCVCLPWRVRLLAAQWYLAWSVTASVPNLPPRSHPSSLPQPHLSLSFPVPVPLALFFLRSYRTHVCSRSMFIVANGLLQCLTPRQ